MTELALDGFDEPAMKFQLVTMMITLQCKCIVRKYVRLVERNTPIQFSKYHLIRYLVIKVINMVNYFVTSPNCRSHLEL